MTDFFHRITNRRMLLLGSVGLGLAFLSGCGEQKREVEESKDEGVYAIEKNYERGPLKVVLKIDNDEPTIADRITLRLETIISEDYELVAPSFGEKLDRFRIVDYDPGQVELLEGGSTRQVTTYLLEPNLSGEYVISPMVYRFRMRGEGGGETELETEELTLQVGSYNPEKAGELEIHDIEPPVEIPEPEPNLFWPLVGGGIAVVLAAVAMLLRGRRKPKEVIVPKIPAHEIAYAELEKLTEDDLAKLGEFREFYQRISDILRRYIENRFGLRAPERTTEEFLVELAQGEALSVDHQPLLRSFLQHCDLVKFAAHEPSSEDMQDTFESCKEFIVETKEESK